MNERELRQLVAKRKKAYDDAVGEKKSVDELRALVAELKEARDLLDLEIEARGLENPPIDPDPESVKRARKDEHDERGLDELEDDEVEARYTKVFLKAIRGKNVTRDDEAIFERVKNIRKFESSVDEEGGLIIPVDMQTKINEFRRQFIALENLVTVEMVMTKSGSRVLEKLADITPFASIEEWDEIGEIENPKFQNKKYAIKDYAGILPIPNTLLQDNDANLMAYVYKWIAKKSIITRNVTILVLLKTLPKKAAITDVDSLKDVYNVELDPELLASSSAVMNQDAFNFLDKLKDKDGKYILQPNPVDATKKLLFGSYPVVTLGNKFLPTVAKKAPIIMGDLKEAAIVFDRGVYEIKATDVGGKSFTRNTTDIRVIDRFDAQLWDDDAAIWGEIDLTAVPAGNE
ncbi:phage major capsid protein [Vagococcus sp. BWB3-3]|uniref:Phage major capsid protein n=1 Tax=Vagococcus allomyrinae TaxID=2794353 RepID=A0A940PBF7_9ENTE|nr:phage major capsid protein [Vagococcus allomyrinae]MBP1040371.1 phage major capsid protein [Vagococcus allomyrinae]